MKEFNLKYSMMLVVMLVVCCAVIGLTICTMSSLNQKLDPPLERNYSKWEYSSFCPLTTTTDELLQIEKTLTSNGYTRVVICPKYRETWTTMERVGTEIFATRRLPAFQKRKGNQ